MKLSDRFSRKMWYIIAAFVVVFVLSGVVVGIVHHQHTEQLREDYTTKYNAICDKCDEHLNKVDDDEHFVYFEEIARDIREMQAYENQQSFLDFGMESQSTGYLEQYCEKIQYTRESLQDEMKREQRINSSSENTRLVNIKKKLEQLDSLYTQTNTGDH